MGLGAGCTPHSLLPHGLCSSPPFALDTLPGSPAEVGLPFPVPPTSNSKPSLGFSALFQNGVGLPPGGQSLYGHRWQN